MGREDLRVLDKIGLDETHAGKSVHKLCDDSVCQEASLNLEMFVWVEKEPGKLTKLYHHLRSSKKMFLVQNNEKKIHKVFSMTVMCLM